MPSRDIQLLLVDDDPSAIQIMDRMLAQYPNKRFATSGAAALRLARELTPDLVLLDIDMPGMTGFEVCAALKSEPVLADVPVIFVTNHVTPALQAAAFEKGAADFVTKPLVASQLTGRVRAQLQAKLVLADLERESLALGAQARPPGPHTARLLIVDDDVASIHLLRHTLASMGDFHFATNGEAALKMARNLDPDLILLDVHMPGMDGFEVCTSLKAQPAFAHVPIAFVTRYSDPRTEARALDLGAADFIAKPYTPAVLQARVRNLLELKRRTDAELRAVREHWRRVGDARVADIVSAASDAIITYCTEGKVVLINAAACRMFDVGHEQAIGSRVQALLGDEVTTGHARQSKAVRTLLARSSGARFPAEVSVSSVGEGIERLTTVMLRDIGDRERLEAEARLRIEAETASRTKTMMMSYIAHEMGNPLNGLLGFAQLMLADALNPLAAAQAKRLEHIMTSGRQMQGLMRDVVDLGRFETGNLNIELRPVHAERCVQGAAEAVSALAQQAGVTMSVAPETTSPMVCSADAARLHQCLVNLLTNAIKYNRAGGWARIELNADLQQVRMAVRDNGIGMDTPQREHLFEPFNRLGRQGAAAIGAGLGLVITRQLVQAMHGQLHVESVAGQGSCFTITLPAAHE